MRSDVAEEWAETLWKSERLEAVLGTADDPKPGGPLG